MRNEEEETTDRRDRMRRRRRNEEEETTDRRDRMRRRRRLS
jgi:hypothetical protein